MPMVVGSQSFISIPSFMFVGAAVSEICESNWNKKKNLQNDYLQFTTFRGHIIFSPELPFDHLHNKVARSFFLKYTHNASQPGAYLYTQYYRTVR